MHKIFLKYSNAEDDNVTNEYLRIRNRFYYVAAIYCFTIKIDLKMGSEFLEYVTDPEDKDALIEMMMNVQLVQHKSNYKDSNTSTVIPLDSHGLFKHKPDETDKFFAQIDRRNNIRLLLTSTSISQRFQENFLEKYRHTDPAIQHEYDKQYGLVLKK